MSERKSPPIVLTGSVGFLLSKLSQKLVQEVAVRLSDMGFQSRHFGVMAVVSERGPMSQKGIGEILAIDRTTMVGLVDDLEKLRLVIRSPDPDDRRAALITLSSEGEDAFRQAMARIQEIEAEFLRPIPEPTKQQLLSVLKTLFSGETS